MIHCIGNKGKAGKCWLLCKPPCWTHPSFKTLNSKPDGHASFDAAQVGFLDLWVYIAGSRPVFHPSVTPNPSFQSCSQCVHHPVFTGTGGCTRCKVPCLGQHNHPYQCRLSDEWIERRSLKGQTHTYHCTQWKYSLGLWDSQALIKSILISKLSQMECKPGPKSAWYNCFSEGFISEMDTWHWLIKSRGDVFLLSGMHWGSGDYWLFWLIHCTPTSGKWQLKLEGPFSALLSWTQFPSEISVSEKKENQWFQALVKVRVQGIEGKSLAVVNHGHSLNSLDLLHFSQGFDPESNLYFSFMSIVSSYDFDGYLVLWSELLKTAYSQFCINF